MNRASNRASHTLRITVPALLVLGAAALVQATRPVDPRPAGVEPVVVPFLMEGVRELVVVDAQVLVHNPAAAGDELRVEEVSLSADGVVLAEAAPARTLVGDPRYGRVQELVERMPHTHRHGPRWFADPEAPELHGEEALRAENEVAALLAELRADHASGLAPSFAHVDLRLPLDQVFHASEPAGTRRTLEVRVTYRTASGPATATVDHTIEKLPPILGPPDSLAATAGTTIHSGDLHVHSCHGEAVGACAPSGNCAAESFQTSGSFTYAQLKTQYQALGVDWFAATDHSYCIDSPAEYAAVVAECAALTDGSFLVAPDIELSSDEVGPQVGSDIGDLACLGTTQANHMGAHGISQWMNGGTEGFLGFCDGLFSDVLDPFTVNAADIRAQGGYPIINHPVDGSSWGWNSKDATLGIEGGGMHGVEIWNGGSQSGQGGHVGDWIDWLLAGRVLYAYSGSDTHDTANPFGMAHAVFDGEPFTLDGLESVVKSGRVYLSGGHFLIVDAEVDGVTYPMGTLQALSPTQPAATVDVNAHYDFGGDTSTITIFKGRVGDPTETVLCVQGGLTGAGTLQCADALDTSGRTWYRAYSDTGSAAAYTNPVFFLPGSCGYTTYGTGLGGANIGTLSSVSNPSIGSFNTLEASGFSPSSTFALYALSPTQIPGGSPFFGGFLLIGLDWVLSGTSTLTGGSGSFTFQIPFVPGFVGGTLYAQAGTIDAGQPGGFALSNGVAFTLCDLLQ